MLMLVYERKTSRTHKFSCALDLFFTDSVCVRDYLIQNVLPVCLGGNNFLYILQGYRDGHNLYTENAESCQDKRLSERPIFTRFCANGNRPAFIGGGSERDETEVK